MTRADRFIGVVLGVACLWALWQATTFPYGAEFAPGPGFAPVWLSAIGAALSFLIAFNSWRWRARLPSEAAATGGRAGLLRAAAGVVGLLLMIQLIPALGFLVALGAYLVFVTLAVERLAPPVGLAASLGTAGFVYLVFGRFLGVPFPRGPLGF